MRGGDTAVWEERDKDEWGILGSELLAVWMERVTKDTDELENENFLMQNGRICPVEVHIKICHYYHNYTLIRT